MVVEPPTSIFGTELSVGHHYNELFDFYENVMIAAVEILATVTLTY